MKTFLIMIAAAIAFLWPVKKRTSGVEEGLSPLKNSKQMDTGNETGAVNAFNPYAGYDSVVYASRFGVRESNTPTGNLRALTRAFNYLSSLPSETKKVLVMPKGETITLSEKFVSAVSLSNFLWYGNGGKILSAIPVSSYGNIASSVVNDYYLITFTSPTAFSNQPVMGPIPKGATTLKLNPAVVAQLQPGDILVITTNKADNLETGYSQGGYKLVESVNTATGVVAVTNPFVNEITLQPTDNLKVTAYKANRNWILKGLNFALYTGSLGTCLGVNHFQNLLVDSCSFDGKAIIRGEARGFAARTKDSYQGMNIKGINVEIRNSRAQRFWDYDLGFGYGFAIGGENITVKNCYLQDCKHGITMGTKQYYSVNLAAENNVGDNAMFEAHQGVKYSFFQYNKMINVGKSTYAQAFFARNYYPTIRHNTITASDTVFPAGSTINAINITSKAGSVGPKIDSNIINLKDMLSYGITNASGTTPTDFSIRGNQITGFGEFGIWIKKGVNGVISGNTLSGAGYAIRLDGASNVRITDNSTVRSNSKDYGGGIFLFTSPTGMESRDIYIANNKLAYKVAASAQNPIKLMEGYDNVVIEGNTISGWNDASTAIFYSGNKNRKRIKVKNNRGSNVNVDINP
jgi:parallel beta-helix repeat protein